MGRLTAAIGDQLSAISDGMRGGRTFLLVVGIGVWGWLTADSVSLIAAGQPLLVDDFESPVNRVNGRSNIYAQEPSRALQVRTQDAAQGGKASLMLKYDKQATGGPYDNGGWCGYYTQVKSGQTWLDASPYTTLTFWVKGAQGDECFMVGLADRHWDELGDSVKSEAIGTYLPAGKITTQWQQARIPLSTFFVDYKELASIAVCFEDACFPEGAGKGTVYLDDVTLE